MDNCSVTIQLKYHWMWGYTTINQMHRNSYLGLTGLSTLDPWAELAGVGTSPSLSFSMDGCGDFTPTPVSLSTMWYWHLPRPDWLIHPGPLGRAGGGGDLSFPVFLNGRVWRFDLSVSLSTMWYWHLPGPDWLIHPGPLSRAGRGGDLSFPVSL